MLAFHVAQLLQAPQGTTRHHTYEVAAEEFADLALIRSVRGEVTLINLGRSILADATYESAVRAECGRCLEPTEVVLRGRLQEEFVPTVDVRTGVRLPPVPEDEAFPIDAEHVLHLDEALRQHLIMALPMRPLCRPDCLGLCATCGADLNRAPCACPPEAPASPFQVLGVLLRNGAPPD
ncbi:MAG TPA: DUF177 domain-containing protein [Chloroflexota bacterium]|nr:DUF177 domain-containing protein [Chloroflexota bacterium]